jgi:hypothetical protein
MRVPTADLVGLADDLEGEEYKIALDHPGESIEMTLHRLTARKLKNSQCRVPVTVTTPQLDGGPVYSPVEEFLQSTLREPGSCRMRVTKTKGNRDHLPLTTQADEQGRLFFVAGDVRVNEVRALCPSYDGGCILYLVCANVCWCDSERSWCSSRVYRY